MPKEHSKQMNKIYLDNEQVTISICGCDRFFAFKSEVLFPRSSILAVYSYNRNLSPPWLRNPGTAIPGLIVAGTYQNLNDRKEFWCTHFNGNTIVIDLNEEKYTRIVCDLPKNEPVDEWIARLA